LIPDRKKLKALLVLHPRRSPSQRLPKRRLYIAPQSSINKSAENSRPAPIVVALLSSSVDLSLLVLMSNPRPSSPPTQPPAINFATEWLDELGRVCPKNVDYATQCPKGHTLAPFDGCGEPPAQQLSDADVICRVCHGSTQRRHAHGWLTCSIAGCCGGYAMCAACVTVLGRALQRDAASTDNFCITVTLDAHAAILRHHICSGCLHAYVLTSSVREYRWSI